MHKKLKTTDMNIKNLKDLSKLQMNAQDVALKGVVELSRKKDSSIIIPDDISDATKKELDDADKLISLQIVSKGKEVNFAVGQYVSLKTERLPPFDELNNDGSERLFVMGMNQIAYALNEVDYEL